MRNIASVLSCLMFAGVLCVSMVTASLGKGRAETRREWNALASGRTEFDVSDPALLPSSLALAAEQAGCRYKDDIKKTPVRFMRPEGLSIAIIFCAGIVGSHQVFDVSDVLKPRPTALPFLAQPDGFGTTTRPGWISWEKEAKVFQAETGSDSSPARLRHIYRVDQETRSFVLVRVDFNPHIRGKDEWATIWETPRWSFTSKRD
jgi:hypothetical protein